MMRASKEPMTVAQLERLMDRRFKSVKLQILGVRVAAARSDQRNRRQFAKIDRRFVSIDRRFVSIDRQFAKVNQEFRRQSEETRRHFDDARRHFDVIAESLRDDLRIFADGIAGQSERLDKHEVRITRLERRAQ
jgi:hypothetical protein